MVTWVALYFPSCTWIQRCNVTNVVVEGLNVIYSLTYFQGLSTYLFLHLHSLGFVTGFRRAPILGMDQIKMRIHVKFIERGSYDQHFPESLTCHSILELPLYSTKEIMRKRLTHALLPESAFFLQATWRHMYSIISMLTLLQNHKFIALQNLRAKAKILYHSTNKQYMIKNTDCLSVI